MSQPPQEDPRTVRLEIEVPGTPEEVWEAIATGPGVSSWLHPTEIDPEAGTFTFDMGSGPQTGRVTAFEPPQRLVQETDWDVPGDASPTVLATEWTVQARGGGSCVVRFVVSGFGTGGSWDEEIEGFRESMELALRTLRLVRRDFPGASGAWLQAYGQGEGSLDDAFARLASELGASFAAGAEVRATAPGAPSLAGTVEDVNTGEWRRDVLVRLSEPAPGVAVLGAFGEGIWTGVQASLFGETADEIAARERPRWEAWIAERFPVQGAGG
jgi:uncharacterized protein YndB with AHSA1/START domain